MPHIENDLKLDFQDVLIRPKRSEVKTRADVELVRTFRFRNSSQELTGVPIVAANMDTVGTFEMAAALARHRIFTAVHKHYSVADWQHFAATAGASVVCREFKSDGPIGSADTVITGVAKSNGLETSNAGGARPDPVGCGATVTIGPFAGDSVGRVLDYVAVSSGCSDADYDRLCAIVAAVPQLRIICLDVANGYLDSFVEFVERVRRAFPRYVIFAGNVASGEMVEALVKAGADIVKVGVGPGSACTTRLKTGIGYPQLSAVLECADAAHGLRAHVVSDGGCTCPGDVAKAFAAGADFVMLGGMLAGHEQSGGELIERDDGRRYKLFYGMSSATAMLKHYGSVADYRASEGRAVEIPFKGHVDVTVRDLLGGLRSTCTYTGAVRLRELPKRTTFIRVSRQLNDTLAPHREVGG